MNILIVGAGMYVTGRDNSGVGTVLASVIQSSDVIDIERVVVFSKNSQSASAVQDASQRINSLLGTTLNIDHFSAEQYSLEELCTKFEFDCALVSTPDHLHFEQVKTLLQLRIHVLCVKPLVATVGQNQELIDLQKSNSVLGIVEFHKRYDEANLYTKDLLTKGELGNINYYTVDYSQKISIPTETFQSWIDHTNIFQYLGVHYVDLFYFMTGFKPVRAMAYGTEGALISKGLKTFDSIHATVIWEDSKGRECLSAFNISWVDPECTSAMSDQKYKIVGEKGRIENDHKYRGIELVSEDSAIKHPNPYFSEFLLDQNGDYKFSGYGFRSIHQFLLDVSELMSGDKQIDDFEDRRPTFRQSLVSSSVIEAVNESLKNSSQWEVINVPL